MAVRPIVRLGHPALRTPASRLAVSRLGAPEVQELIDDMVATMREAEGVGLAAPQVGVGLQVFVYEAMSAGTVEPEELQDSMDGAEGAAGRGRRHGRIPLHVLVNPRIAPQAGELVEDWEGCLSIPDLRGLVPRHPRVRVQGLDRDGRPLDYLAGDFEARIVQHELDHLKGIVFLDRMLDLRTLAFYEEWERFVLGGESEREEEDAGDTDL
ncbi:MAG TPA: peptide deformylase [Thermoanaerobaculia bacterium]|nr:peptide deformylase [Thermoanaerobaculia bacterium]